MPSGTPHVIPRPVGCHRALNAPHLLDEYTDHLADRLRLCKHRDILYLDAYPLLYLREKLVPLERIKSQFATYAHVQLEHLRVESRLL
eukprot:CAMPEP_0181196524 /NCGR_PEP_ID=MMETSP1096-20121128/15515_1 /TAXON_ID=156174 ORGANISM="Chrysochromulina ericina, Strain CCMP281" /NCGR_SAMPLE_ID=MMETSP1096 /ASSEMBLY_ACC=CAM_ASM_000453 /LENGTH=87 /DNA_ID=CAMNT_0023286297 /DNA_START=317 /DNA_END=580 /DNA_ORIENTATION=-